MQLNEVQRRHLAVTRFFFPGYVQLVVVPLLPARLWLGGPELAAFRPRSRCRRARGGWPRWRLGCAACPGPDTRGGAGVCGSSLRGREPQTLVFCYGRCCRAWSCWPWERAVPAFIGGACAIKGPTCLMGSDPVQVDFRGHQQVTIASHLPPLPPAFPFSKRFSIHFSSFQ